MRTITCFLLLAAVASATVNMHGPPTVHRYLVQADFGPSGNGFPSSGTATGTPDANNTTNIGASDFSLRCATSADRLNWSFSPQTDLWFFVRGRKEATAAASAAFPLSLLSSGSGVIQYRESTNTGNRLYVGTTTFHTLTVSNGVDFALWIRWQASTGTATIYFQTDGTENRPSAMSPLVVSSLIGTTLDVVKLSAAASAAMSWGKLRVSTTEIGSNPP